MDMDVYVFMCTNVSVSLLLWPHLGRPGPATFTDVGADAPGAAVHVHTSAFPPLAVIHWS